MVSLLLLLLVLLLLLLLLLFFFSRVGLAWGKRACVRVGAVGSVDNEPIFSDKREEFWGLRCDVGKRVAFCELFYFWGGWSAYWSSLFFWGVLS